MLNKLKGHLINVSTPASLSLVFARVTLIAALQNLHIDWLFLPCSLAVLVATTTLAMGVNLPARLVIIKGTNHYRGPKGYQELPRWVSRVLRALSNLDWFASSTMLDRV